LYNDFPCYSGLLSSVILILRNPNTEIQTSTTEFYCQHHIRCHRQRYRHLKSNIFAGCFCFFRLFRKYIFYQPKNRLFRDIPPYVCDSTDSGRNFLANCLCWRGYSIILFIRLCKNKHFLLIAINNFSI